MAGGLCGAAGAELAGGVALTLCLLCPRRDSRRRARRRVTSATSSDRPWRRTAAVDLAGMRRALRKWMPRQWNPRGGILPATQRSSPMKIITRTASTVCVLAIVVAIVAALAQAQNQPQGQTPRPANQTPNQQDLATEDFAAPAAFPLAAPAGVDSRAIDDGAGQCRQHRSLRSGDVEIRHGIQSAAGREDLESREAQDAAGRQGDRRHAVQRHRSGHLLRDGRRPATTSSGPRCSTTSATGTRRRAMWRTCPHAEAVPGVRVA